MTNNYLLEKIENFSEKNQEHPNNTSRIASLQKTFEKIMTSYNVASEPSFNPKLMKVHYLLALLYKKEGNEDYAKYHFNRAGSELNVGIIEEKQRRNNAYFVEGDTTFFDRQDARLKQLEFYEKKLNGVARKVYLDDLEGAVRDNFRVSTITILKSN